MQSEEKQIPPPEETDPQPAAVPISEQEPASPVISGEEISPRLRKVFWYSLLATIVMFAVFSLTEALLYHWLSDFSLFPSEAVFGTPWAIAFFTLVGSSLLIIFRHVRSSGRTTVHARLFIVALALISLAALYGFVQGVTTFGFTNTTAANAIGTTAVTFVVSLALAALPVVFALLTARRFPGRWRRIVGTVWYTLYAAAATFVAFVCYAIIAITFDPPQE